MAIYMGGKQHNLGTWEMGHGRKTLTILLVIMPSVGRSLMALRPSILSVDSLGLYILDKFFGDRGSSIRIDEQGRTHDIHRALNMLLKEPFLSSAVAKTARMIEGKGTNFVSFNESIVDQFPWEKAAGVEVIDADRPAVKTELASLVRNFVGEIACEVLMGSAFMANNPNALRDLTTMDSKFNLFLLGLPKWATPGMWQAFAARKRLLTAVEAFGRALDAVDDGLDPGHAWDDASDISIIMRERRKAWRKWNAPMEAYSAVSLPVNQLPAFVFRCVNRCTFTHSCTAVDLRFGQLFPFTCNSWHTNPALFPYGKFSMLNNSLIRHSRVILPSSGP